MNHITNQPVKCSHHTTFASPPLPRACTHAIPPRHPHPPQRTHSPQKVARNFPWSVFNAAYKRCNSNDAISMFERFTWELRATLLGNHTCNARDARIIHIRTSPDQQRTPASSRTHKTAPASSHGDRGRGRGWLGRRARSAYSLTPPAVRPETMYFCRYWNSRITGMAAMTEPAAKMPHGAVRSSAAHMYMPTARVNWL